jgi:hypothetical protein
MAGTKKGGLRAAESNKKRHGDDFYEVIGAIGGKAKVPKGFAKNLELARKAGRMSSRARKENQLSREGNYGTKNN